VAKAGTIKMKTMDIMDTKEVFKENLDELGMQIDLLSKDVKDMYKKQVADLKHQWVLLREKWNAVVEEGGGAWDDVKDSLRSGMAEISASYEDIKNKL